MFRETVETALRDDHGSDGYLFPAYEDYCFLNVPGTVQSLFGLDGPRRLPDDVFQGVDTNVEHVLLVLIDGFGLDCWKRDRGRHGFLEAITELGTVTPLTSIYPSETGAAIPTLHTGRTTLEHGRIGWDMYFADLDIVVQTLPFLTPDGREPGEAADREVDRTLISPGEPIYGRMQDAGVEVHRFPPASIADEESDDSMVTGTRVHGYENVAEMALELRRTLEAATGPTYCYAYLPHIDAVSHRTGTESEDYQAQLAMLLGCLRRELLEQLDDETASETLLLLTADHGHVDTDPDDAIDLLAYDEVVDALVRHANGDPVPPVGSPRNAHLHVQDGRAEDVARFLDAELDAQVFTQNEALDRGLFGPGDPHPEFERRCGDVVLTGRRRAIYHEGGLKGYVGLHGGLHPAEMLVPFAAVRLSTLR